MDELVSLVKKIAQCLVDSPNELKVEYHVDSYNCVIFYLTPRQGEAGQLIGREGKIVTAFRILVRSCGRKFRFSNVSLEIMTKDSQLTLEVEGEKNGYCTESEQESTDRADSADESEQRICKGSQFNPLGVDTSSSHINTLSMG